MREIEIEDLVARLLDEFDARAAGFWQLETNRLVLRTFVPAHDLDAQVARSFAEATRAVGIDRIGLGIVKALVSGQPAVSIAKELPADKGSGGWLRSFGASCSVAVPVADGSGQVVAVIAAALTSRPADEAAVAARISDLGKSIFVE